MGKKHLGGDRTVLCKLRGLLPERARLRGAIPAEERIFPLHRKMIIAFAVFILLIGLSGYYANFGLQVISRLLHGILAENQMLEELRESLYTLRYATERFVVEGSRDSWEQYNIACDALAGQRQKLAAIMETSRDESTVYQFIDLERAVQHIMQLSQQATAARRQGQSEAAYKLTQDVVAAANIAGQQIVAIANANTQRGSRQYKAMERGMKSVRLLSYLLALSVGGLGIIFIINFSRGITQPLYRIIENAEEMATGNFAVGPVETNTRDELQIITRVFNRMSRSIAELFQQIQEKANLERQLKEEKLRNLEISNLLREAEIQALQSQINPHFLYNTLNAIVQVAILEDADETAELIKTVSRLLRYNLRSLDKPVTLQEELEHVRTYVHIMGVRYGDKIDCRIDIPPNAEMYMIPGMIIQPLVENAYIHGVGRLEGRRGRIWVEAREEAGFLYLTIGDNGVGMSSEQVHKLLAEDAGGQPGGGSVVHGHVTGLGLRNIRNRLKLFYNSEDTFKLTSEPGKGTVVELKLPRKEWEPSCMVS